MKIATQLSMAALIALLALNSCGANRAGDISTDPGTQEPGDNKPDPNLDNDGDGLTNGQEDSNWNGIVDDGETDPKKRDTDGDGLWDGNEIKTYQTDPLNRDTDEDGVTDGREVYTCDETTFDTLMVTQHAPANLNHKDSPDVIDALEPLNDSDRDGYVNLGEKNAGTDPCDPNSHPEPPKCAGIELAGGVYIPGGFDVDGDGVKENGFWFTPYPASQTNTELDPVRYEKFNSTMSEKFNILNGSRLEYNTGTVYHSNTVYKPKFTDQGSNSDNYMSALYGMDMPVAVDSLMIPECQDAAGSAKYGATIPSNKQYIHILKLLEAYDGDEVTVKNGLLGIDPNVPIDYETKVYYIGDFKEFTRDIAVLNNFEAPSYWNIRSEAMVDDSEDQEDISPLKAWADIDVGFGFPGWKDPAAIVVRQGWNINITYGIGSGDNTEGQGVLFRMATPYLDPAK
ncbi:MAG: hypothetical protein KN64_01550 [Sulfurovum sp. AS07-7]|nr:MAG: hypothetical protein KN64_01550 [Sulfurovum sp. AS07-7]